MLPTHSEQASRLSDVQQHYSYVSSFCGRFGFPLCMLSGLEQVPYCEPRRVQRSFFIESASRCDDLANRPSIQTIGCLYNLLKTRCCCKFFYPWKGLCQRIQRF